MGGVGAEPAQIGDRGYANVMIEIGNEVDHGIYCHDIIGEPRVDELIRLVQERSAGKVDAPAGRLLASASLTGGKVPGAGLVDAADFVLLHGNGVGEPDGIRDMVEATRAVTTYRGRPILFNEDDHFDFDQADNNCLAAVSCYTGWGYFDYRMEGEDHHAGYQSVPVDWSTSSERKRGFYRLLAQVTGASEA